jgi:hypothetical protein
VDQSIATICGDELPERASAEVAEDSAGAAGEQRSRLVAKLDRRGVAGGVNGSMKGVEVAFPAKTIDRIVADASRAHLCTGDAASLVSGNGCDPLVPTPRNADGTTDP